MIKENIDGILQSELKDGFILKRYPCNDYNTIDFDLIYSIKSSFSINKFDVVLSGHNKETVRYLIRNGEQMIVDKIREAVFGFPQSNRLGVCGIKIKTSTSCPQGECIIHPMDFHSLTAICNNGFHDGALSL